MHTHFSLRNSNWVPNVYLNKCDLLNKYTSTNTINLVSLTRIDLNFSFNQVKKLSSKKLILTKHQTQICFFFLFFTFINTPFIKCSKFKTIDDFTKEINLLLTLESPKDLNSFLQLILLESFSKKKIVVSKKLDLVDSKVFSFTNRYSFSTFFEIDDFLNKLNIASNDLFLNVTFHFQNKNIFHSSKIDSWSKIKYIQNSYLFWLL